MSKFFHSNDIQPTAPADSCFFDLSGFHTACLDSMREVEVNTAFIRWDIPYYFCENDTTDTATNSIEDHKKSAPAQWRADEVTSTIGLKSLGAMLHRQGLRKAPHDVQMKATRIIELDQNLDDIFASMKTKGRYNVRLARKKGVQCRVCSVEDFYTLHKKTSVEKKIATRSLAYMRDLQNIFGSACTCYGAYIHDRMIASVMVLHFDTCASYLFGGAERKESHLMASYAIQWHAIEQAKERGMQVYDFMGINTEDKKYAGITRFKEKFGGLVLSRMGSWDIPLNRLTMTLFRGAELLRAR